MTGKSRIQRFQCNPPYTRMLIVPYSLNGIKINLFIDFFDFLIFLDHLTPSCSKVGVLPAFVLYLNCLMYSPACIIRTATSTFQAPRPRRCTMLLSSFSLVYPADSHTLNLPLSLSSHSPTCSGVHFGKVG